MGLTRKLRGGVPMVKNIKKKTFVSTMPVKPSTMPVKPSTMLVKPSNMQDQALTHAKNLKKKAQETATKGKNVLVGLFNTATKKISDTVGGKYNKKSRRKIKKSKKSKKSKKVRKSRK
tara:strand:+ start:1513 stop:1866 length:354 start_codon:yes stop_codon:yes gene_type:complete